MTVFEIDFFFEKLKNPLNTPPENMKKVDQQNAMDSKFADAIINDQMLNGQ